MPTTKSKKLTLRTETVRSLSAEELSAVEGAGFEILTPFLPTRVLSAAGCPPATTVFGTLAQTTRATSALSR